MSDSRLADPKEIVLLTAPPRLIGIASMRRGCEELAIGLSALLRLERRRLCHIAKEGSGCLTSAGKKFC